MSEESTSVSPTPEKSSEWSYSELFGKAYKITTKNPVLWWFAIAMAGMGSYQGNGGGSSSSDSSSLQKLFNSSNTDQAAKVLGDATSPFMDLFSQIFTAIPWYFYLILGIEILILGIGAIVVTLTYQAWAQAGLLSGVEDAIAEKKPSMAEMSEKAFPLIKSFIWLNIVPPLIFALLSVAILGMLVFLLIIVPGNIKILIGILLFLGIIVFVTVLFHLVMALIWAPRKVVLDHVPASHAFGAGLHIARKKFWKTLLYGGINMILSGLIIGAAILLPIGLLLLGGGTAALLWKDMGALSITIITILVALFFVWLIAFTLLSGIMDSFKAAFWSVAYHKIRGKYEH